MHRTKAIPAKYLKDGVPDDLKDKFGHVEMTPEEIQARSDREAALAAIPVVQPRPNDQKMLDALIKGDTVEIARLKKQLQDWESAK